MQLNYIEHKPISQIILHARYLQNTKCRYPYEIYPYETACIPHRVSEIILIRPKRARHIKLMLNVIDKNLSVQIATSRLLSNLPSSPSGCANNVVR